MQLPAFVKQIQSQLSSELQWGLQLQLLTVSRIAIKIAFANTSEFAITPAMQLAIRLKVASSRSTRLAPCDHKCNILHRLAIIIATPRWRDASRRLCDRVCKLAHRIAIVSWSALCCGPSTRCIETLALQFMIQSRILNSICVKLHLFFSVVIACDIQNTHWNSSCNCNCGGDDAEVWKQNWNTMKFT